MSEIRPKSSSYNRGSYILLVLGLDYNHIPNLFTCLWLKFGIVTLGFMSYNLVIYVDPYTKQR